MRWRDLAGLVVVALAINACNGATPPTAPDALPANPGTPPPQGTGVVGQFVGVGHSAAGSVRFTVQNGVGELQFSTDFVVDAVPGPFVYVNTTNNPNTGSPLRISALRSNRGAQTYAFQVPAGVRYTFVLVWCDPFNTGVAQAPIPPTP